MHDQLNFFEIDLKESVLSVNKQLNKVTNLGNKNILSSQSSINEDRNSLVDSIHHNAGKTDDDDAGANRILTAAYTARTLDPLLPALQSPGRQVCTTANTHRGSLM